MADKIIPDATPEIEGIIEQLKIIESKHRQVLAIPPEEGHNHFNNEESVINAIHNLRLALAAMYCFHHAERLACGCDPKPMPEFVKKAHIREMRDRDKL